MNKNIIIGILVAAVIALAIALYLKQKTPTQFEEEDIGKTFVDENGVTNIVVKATTKINGETETEIEAAPITRSVERRPLEPEATKRLHDGPVIVSALFEASGRAEHASYGKAIRGSYLYTTTVKARSEIVETNVNETTGSIRVVEKRTFTQARDSLALFDLDAAIALDTIPVNQVKGWIDNACDFVGGVVGQFIPGAKALSTVVKKSVEAAYAALSAIDGTSARGMLGMFDVKVPENLEVLVSERVTQLAGRQLQAVKTALQSIEGKTFIITYTQAANGMPLNVDFAHDSGGPITAAEWEILRSANAFLDSNAVPDTRCRVGDSWTIWADEAQELFGSAGDGRAEGKIRVERIADQTDGTWTLKVEPSEITFRSNDDTASGTLRVKDGNGLVDGKNASVKSLQAIAEGNLSSMNEKRHALYFKFVKRINGDSNLRFTLMVDPAE